MSALDEIVGQLLLVGFSNGDEGNGFEMVKSQIQRGEISGVVLYRHNIKNPSVLGKTAEEIFGVPAKHMPLMAVDQEGGLVLRMDSKNGFDFVCGGKEKEGKNEKTDDLPSAEHVARENNPTEAYAAYGATADMLRTYGINVNLAPCVDVNINPASIIGRRGRSYSSEGAVVAAYAGMCVEAHARRGVATVLKHFPGHGSPTGDTHEGVVDTTHTWTERELEPYRILLGCNSNAIATDVSTSSAIETLNTATHEPPFAISNPLLTMVMVAHVYNSTLDDTYPASLSKKTVTGLLREKLGYTGVVVSDDLGMRAVWDHYKLEEIVVRSLGAGVDMLLFSNVWDCELPRKVREIVGRAVQMGELCMDGLRGAYERVVAMKREIEKIGKGKEKERGDCEPKLE